MLKKIIIHVGNPKAGSTTIQKFLSLNSLELLRNGILIPSYKSLANKKYSHIKLAAYCCKYSNIINLANEENILNEHMQKKEYENLKESLKSQINNNPQIHTIIISHENLGVSVKTEMEIQKIKSLFISFCKNIKILIYLRRQDEAIISGYTQKLKKGLSKPMVLEELHSDWLNYYERIKFWEKGFNKGNVIPRVFSKEKFVNGNLIDDFLFACDIEKNKNLYKSGNVFNRGPSKEVCELLLKFNIMANYHNIDKNEAQDFRFKLISALSNPQNYIKFEAPENEKEMFLKKYERGNLLLANEYFNMDNVSLF